MQGTGGPRPAQQNAGNEGGNGYGQHQPPQIVRGTVGAVTGTLARPYIANAAATTATVWWTQGFIPEEDAGFRKMVADYQKASGNTIDYSLMPFAPLMQKIVSAITSGDVPDLISHDVADQQIIPQNAWDDKIVDVSDVVETQKAQYNRPCSLDFAILQQYEQEARAFTLCPIKRQ